MGAEKGNNYWRFRRDLSEYGKKLSPEELVKGIADYCDFVINNPIIEQVVFNGRDGVVKDTIERMRPMIIEGCCHYLGINTQTWKNWMKDEKYLGILTHAEQLFIAQKVEGTAAGQLKETFMARYMGLKDRTDTTTDDKPLDNTIKVEIINPD